MAPAHWLGAFLAANVACGGEVTCDQSLADFCQTSTCAMQIDPNDPLGSFCAATAPDASLPTSAVVTWGECDGVIQIESGNRVYEYATTGKLEAVFTGSQCSAGPASIASTSCPRETIGACP